MNHLDKNQRKPFFQKYFVLLFWLPVLVFIGYSCQGVSRPEEGYVLLADSAPIMPDYADSIVIPCNIAPLNFCFARESAWNSGKVFFDGVDSLGNRVEGFGTRIRNQGGTCIPLEKWKTLLDKAKGGYLEVSIFAYPSSEKSSGKGSLSTDLSLFKKLRWFVSPDTIDKYLLFRASQYEEGVHGHLYLRERNLENFEYRQILDNRLMDNNCMNCHDCRNNNSSEMVVHLREAHAGTLLIRGDSVLKIAVPSGYNLRLTYPAWHPSGKWVAFSTNLPRSVHYANAVEKIIYTLDTLGDIVMMDVENLRLFSCPELTSPEYEDVFPTWSPDGTRLYFCRSIRKDYDSLPFPEYYDSTLSARQNRVEQIWDDLMQIDFDTATGKFSGLECTYPFSKMQKSASMPKITRDGKRLVISLLKTSTFPLQNLGDFYMLDVGVSGCLREVQELNTDGSEKGHSFSSTGKWMVFSSSRRTMAIPETYITYYDEDKGFFGKPFLVPQERGDFYYTNLKGFVFPVLSTRPGFLDAGGITPHVKNPPEMLKIDKSLEKFRMKPGQTILTGGH